MAAKLSFPMRRALAALLDGRWVGEHCRNISDYGGLEGTMRALRNRGLIEWDHTNEPALTAEGRRAAEALRSEGKK